MVDHVKALGRKLTYPKAVLTGYTLLFFLYFLPFPEVQFIKQIPFENLFGGSWFLIIGGAFFLEGMIGLPDMKKGTSRYSAYIVIGLGIIAVLVGASVMIEGITVFNNVQYAEFLAPIVLGMASLLFFSMMYSELAHRKSFLHLVQSNV